MSSAAKSPARVVRSAWMMAMVGLVFALGACGGDVSVALPLGGGGEYVLGNQAGGGSLGFGANSLGGQPVTIPADTNLLRLGLITVGGSANYQMAVYTDSGSQPGALVISSTSMAMVDGPQEVAVSPTVLLTGTYWIMFITDAVTNIGNTGSSTPYRYVSHTFGTALPGALFSTTSGPAHDLSIWMVVQD